MNFGRAKNLLVIATLLIFLSAVLVGFLLFLGQFHVQPAIVTQEESSKLIYKAAIARINAQSRGISQETEISGITNPKKFEDSERVESNSLPEGYSVTSYEGTMILAQAAPEEQSLKEWPDYAWIGTPGVRTFVVQQADKAGRDWTFGWIQLTRGTDKEDVYPLLIQHGVKILGVAGNLLRTRLPGDEKLLDSIANIEGVVGFGITPDDIKVNPSIFDLLLESGNERLPVFVTLMSGDQEGRWKNELQHLGAVVGRYDIPLRTYVAHVDYSALTRLVGADFVLHVEPIQIVKTAHDTAIPALGVDGVRSYSGELGIFNGIGGEDITIGVMDTGLNIRHSDITHYRESICGANFNSFGSDADEDLWIDEDGHGTHVTATIVGNGFSDARFSGMAPSVRHIRFAKVLSSYGGYEDEVIQGMDYLAKQSGCKESAKSRPLIVNMSLAASDKFFEGRGTTVRKVDSLVWDKRQLYVVAVSNFGSDRFSNYAGAKNSLAIGAALDTGEIAAFSSHGPTGDGRLAPQIVATGVNVRSATGEGSAAGYVTYSGTSMASPSAAGVAALLMDAAPEFRSEPAMARARIMASAIRPDLWLDDEEGFPTHNSNGPGELQKRYGLGKISTPTTLFSKNSKSGWAGGSVKTDLDEEGTFAYYDIEVPQGASRLDLVLTWDESPVDVVVAPVLNDLDLWLDYGTGSCGGRCGEWSSTSQLDNVEWIIVREPKPGTYRAKVVAERIYSEKPRAALAWTIIRGASTPELQLDTKVISRSTDSDTTLAKVDVLASVDEFVAAGSRLHFSCQGPKEDCSQLEYLEARVERLDDVVTEVAQDGPAWWRSRWNEPDVRSLDATIPLGDIAVGQQRSVRILTRYSGEREVKLNVVASAWNASSASASFEITSRSIDLESIEESSVSNDDCTARTALDGASGSTNLDLSLATTEPGEPVYGGPCVNNDCFSFTYRGCPFFRDNSYYERPVASVWYEWTAPTNDLAQMRIADEEGHYPDGVAVTIYEGDRLSALRQTATNHWEEPELVAATRACVYYGATKYFTDQVAFLARSDTTYILRVSSNGTSPPMVLNWSLGRPLNDDFQSATALSKPEGSVSGSNVGATRETGETLGQLAASVWYEWIAPENGVWTFEVDNEKLRVAVFEGRSMNSARLVSAFPDTEARFKAGRDRAYRILVAAEDGSTHPRRFELKWEQPSWTYFWSGDEFDDAEEAEVDKRHSVSLGENTVDPGEPIATGISTGWWIWTSPDTKSYTLKTYYEELDVLLSVFTGDELDNLHLVATNKDSLYSGEFKFPAQEGTRYSLSVGWPIGESRAFVSKYGFESTSWTFGPTPTHDVRVGAIALEGIEGEVLASAKFATTGPGELSDLLGKSSLWWQYRSPEAGWYRFFVDTDYAFEDRKYAIAIYEKNTFDTPLVRSGWLEDERGVVFYADADTDYVVRIGLRGYISDSNYEYTLRWEKTNAPTWLRYVNAQREGIDDQGNATTLAYPSKLALNDVDSYLFAITEVGLVIFERDVANGSLMPIQFLDISTQDALISWVANSERLIVNQCSSWQAVSQTARQSSNTFEISNLQLDNDQDACGVQLFGVGNHIYKLIKDVGIDRYTLEDTTRLDYGGHYAFERWDRALNAVANADGTRIYASGDGDLLTFERDEDTGDLTMLESVYSSSNDSIALSHDNRFLFLVDSDYLFRIEFFSIEDGLPANSEFDYISMLDTPLDYDTDRYWRFANPRSDQIAIDFFGYDAAISLRMDEGEDEPEMRIGDVLGDGMDRFGNYVPLYGMPRGLVASKDGKFVYVSTDQHGILIFERIPVRDDAETDE